MKNIFTILLFALFFTSCMQVQRNKTFEFTYEGKTLKYEVARNEATVSKRSEKISGDVKIPQSVTFAGKEYKVTSIGDEAFGWCTSLTSVIIPSSVKTIGERAFEGCDSLTNVIIPNGVTKIKEAAFGSCGGLTNVSLPKSVKTIGECPFWGKNLKSINVAKDNSHYCSENGVLFDAPKKTLIQYPIGTKGKYVIPNSVNTIGPGAFMYCDSLTDVTISNNVEIIGRGAFGACKGLTSVTIPSSVKTIDERAFAFCEALASITILRSTPPNVSESSFMYCDIPESFHLYVPAESVEKYKTAKGWSKYADKIKAIEK
ncbi:MAG: leucine-rich repeat domain-containing protein [Paludibacteraceae bacterium]|nr:leucine-rich repeat domain-containing protein [Paludibacteraceae bacterium]